VSIFLRQAEEILETAELGSQEVAIAIDRRGGVHMLDPTGWSLPAMRAEFGADAVFKVERRGSTIRVDGWDGFRSCRLEKCVASPRTAKFSCLLQRPMDALPAPA
jgi:hypothetical protein